MAKDRLIGEGKKRRIHPADRERKNAHKREKLKNKLQRKESRGSVLRAKDPAKMLEEMYELDEQEYILSQNPTGQENLVKVKKRKLKDTFEKVLLFYQRDSKEKYLEIKKLQHEYELKKRDIPKNILAKNKLQEASLQINDPIQRILPNIPLPGESVNTSLLQNIPTTQRPISESPSQKKIPPLPSHIFPPGPPPTMPPDTAIPVPPELLSQFVQNVSNASRFAPQGYPYDYLYDPLPPPPPPPKKYHVPAASSSSSRVISEHDYLISAEPDTIKSFEPTPAVISAIPQLRDMQAEVTKLVPISVLKKREENNPQKKKPSSRPNMLIRNLPDSAPCEDDKYSAFIKELDNL